ncbi:MAG: hypothetical protein EOP08_14235 [Proteobacteria bacterium]|nr:MAG: hypothetical protein EOP08_14235 [Pseudomonadota bacterium]
MALNAGQKAERVLKFLTGLRSKPAVRALAAYGFTEADADEGWELLRATGRVAFNKVTGDPIDNSLIVEIDGWENRWFPVVRATLDRRFPAVCAQLFLNLTQQVGAAATLSVGMFLERYDEMSAGKGSYGKDGEAAKKILVQRGLTAEEIERARTLLVQIGSIDLSEDDEETQEDPAAFDTAQTDLWKWYLEWSQVARIAITSKPILRTLGFGKPRRASASDESTDDLDEDVSEPVQPVQPAPVPA